MVESGDGGKETVEESAVAAAAVADVRGGTARNKEKKEQGETHQNRTDTVVIRR